MGYVNHRRVARRWRAWGEVSYWKHWQTGRIFAVVTQRKGLDGRINLD